MNVSLNDDLDFINMKQTKTYKEESADESIQKEIDALNENLTSNEEPAPREPNSENPFGKRLTKKPDRPPVNKKGFLIIGVVVLLIGIVSAGGYFAYDYFSKDKGADWLEEVEGEVTEFKYDLTERELLRNNGYTADDIERYQVEERDPYELVSEAQEARRLINESEVKPYLDGASDKYKELERMTWLGGKPVSEEVLQGKEFDYQITYGTFNCDYDKVPPMGAQLFLRLELDEYGEYVFMTVDSKRYVELKDSGNIVVNIDYNIYPDGSIVVTNVREKDIQ